MLVQKFGGTSVQSSDRIQSVAAIVKQAREKEPVAVVVSAMSGITDLLLTLAKQSGAGQAVKLDELRQRHLTAAKELGADDEVMMNIEQLLDDVASLLHGVYLVRDASARVLDAIAAHGELLSAQLVAAALRQAGTPAVAVDARKFIITDDSYTRAVVDRVATYERTRAFLAKLDAVPVVTGFIAANASGTTTTLGRGGSDYTATLLGAALNARMVEIWTDVDGVMSADPRLVSQAFSIDQLTFTELMELAHFGAKVIYPPSVTPARDAGIPLAIRNTLNPAYPGTLIVVEGKSAHGGPRGVTSISDVALCRLEGAGMLGVAGIAGRLFAALARDGVSVILISQASSEHSICFAVEPNFNPRVVDAEFEIERAAGAVDPLIVERGLSVIAAVGEAMRETPGVAGQVFDVLGRNGINVRAIAQGSSELNISLVVPREEETRALRLIHDAFYLPRIRTMQVFIAGTGRVGAALLDQLSREMPNLPQRTGVRLLISGIARSSKALLDADGLSLEDWTARMDASTSTAKDMVDAALTSKNAHRVFVDCTANAQLTEHYEELMRTGVAIVSANKIALSQSLESYRRLRARAQEGKGMYVETTVGAGLPVLRPIADLVATGDRIHAIEGVLSGTLSFLFGRIMAGIPFSEAVKEAHALGFTEPDPRDDLNGRDVARKLLILGREADFEIEPAQVEVKGVLEGERWASLSIDEFWKDLPSVDADFAERREAAIAAKQVLCYLGSIGTDGARVAMRSLPAAHAAASLLPGDNLIAISSERYNERPLVIRGPGAGPAVTAAGVFADILRAANESR